MRFRSVLGSRNVMALADCLAAMQRGDDTTDAHVGRMFVAAAILALLPEAR